MTKIWKVFTKDTHGFGDKSYFYIKQEAQERRLYWQSLGIVKVMIKGRKI